MTQIISDVQQQRVEQGLFIEVTIEATVLRFTTGFETRTYNGNTYNPLGQFLGISDIQNTISNTSDEMTISLSAVNNQYLPDILTRQIKGGEVKIYRYFLNRGLYQASNTYNVYTRFIGVITNYAISEDIDTDGVGTNINYTISLICSSIFGVLDSRISGRRTNQQDYQTYYNETYITNNITTDPSMNRVIKLFDEKFDFGLPYKPQGQSTVQNTMESAPPDPNDIRDAG